jgi:hypothetical protein
MRARKLAQRGQKSAIEGATKAHGEFPFVISHAGWRIDGPLGPFKLQTWLINRHTGTVLWEEDSQSFPVRPLVPLSLVASLGHTRRTVGATWNHKE